MKRCWNDGAVDTHGRVSGHIVTECYQSILYICMQFSNNKNISENITEILLCVSLHYAQSFQKSQMEPVVGNGKKDLIVR